MADTRPEGTIRIRDMAGLLAFVPALVGFTPERSLVVMFLAGHRVAMTMRADLDGANVAQLVATTLRAARQSAAEELVIAAYMPNVSEVTRAIVCDLAAGIELESIDDEPPLRVLGLAAVGRDGWCELDPWEPGAPPLRPLAELEEHAMRAQGVYEGRVVAASRDEVAARVKPDSEERSTTFEVVAEAVVLALPTLSDHDAAQLMTDHLDEVEGLATGAAIDEVSLARMMVLLAHPAARDAAMLRIDRDNALVWVAAWSRVVRVSGGWVACAALFLTGVAAWQAGDGALMNCCADAARLIDPEHIGVKVMTMVADCALPPSFFDTVKGDLREAS